MEKDSACWNRQQRWCWLSRSSLIQSEPEVQKWAESLFPVTKATLQQISDIAEKAYWHKKQQFWAFQTKLIYCWPWTSLGLCLKAQALKICARIKKALILEKSGEFYWRKVEGAQKGSKASFLYAIRLDPKLKALKALKHIIFNCQQLWHSGRAQA